MSATNGIVPPPHVKIDKAAAFETPIVVAALENVEPVRAALEAAIRARRAESAGLQRSNQGGWHSDTGLLTWGGAAAQALAQAAVGVAQRMTHIAHGGAGDWDWRVSAWANISPPGASNALHAHPGNVWAAVYYVATGADEGEAAGALFLEDPRFPLTMMHAPGLLLLGSDGKPQRSQIEIAARAGDLVVFPAWLRHGVRPHRGSGERISVALNIDVRLKDKGGG